MFKLVFFTTNNVKLAHARHMADGHHLVIESFRRKTFYASYTEPQIDSRNELLKQSYESALEQAKNSGMNVKRKFFFLEDTSVIIDALSTQEKEVPGVNVKFWMEVMEFESLDRILREKSNRNVTVRSDILLHVPCYYRKKWKIEEQYLIFVGTQEGTIVEIEQEFETNLVFPWLDNKTFNKWFVPQGESKPISCLSIEKADIYDFRRHAFLQMVKFFSGKGMLFPLSKQVSFSLSPPTLLICGYPCAGKTTLSQYLVCKFGYIHIEASDFMYLSFYLRHGVGSGVRISDFAEESLKQKPEIASEKIAEYMECLGELPVVISGFRSMREIEWLQNFFDEKGVRKSFLLGYIDASQQIRFKRYNKRKRDGQEISVEQFRIQDKQQIRMGLEEISLSTSRKSICNENTLEEFFQESEAMLSLSKISKISLLDTKFDFSIFGDFSKDIGLEKPIFMALLSEWEEGEDRRYFTTTEITKLINKLFPGMKPKYKDNVSRYFNQDFYVFYEIDPDPDESKRKYRLSNTGYGRAISIYYELERNYSKQA